MSRLTQLSEEDNVTFEEVSEVPDDFRQFVLDKRSVMGGDRGGKPGY